MTRARATLEFLVEALIPWDPSESDRDAEPYTPTPKP